MSYKSKSRTTSSFSLVIHPVSSLILLDQTVLSWVRLGEYDGSDSSENCGKNHKISDFYPHLVLSLVHDVLIDSVWYLINTCKVFIMNQNSLIQSIRSVGGDIPEYWSIFCLQKVLLKGQNFVNHKIHIVHVVHVVHVVSKALVELTHTDKHLEF